MRVSNEPCTDKTDDSRWELAHNRMAAGLGVYGECRDSERTKFSNMSAWLIVTIILWVGNSSGEEGGL